MSMIDRDTDQNRPATSSRSSFGSMSDSSSSNSDNNSTSAPRRPSLTVSLPDDDGRYIKVCPLPNLSALFPSHPITLHVYRITYSSSLLLSFSISLPFFLSLGRRDLW